jgi:hypothetical protein
MVACRKTLVRETGAGLRLADCRDQAKHLHRLEYALHVGTATVVATQPETHACLAHVVDWGDAALEFEVAELIEHDPRVGSGHAIDLSARDPYAMDDVQPGSEQADIIHIADQRAVMIRE